MQLCLEVGWLHQFSIHLVGLYSPLVLTLFGIFVLLSLELDSKSVGTAFLSPFTVAINYTGNHIGHFILTEQSV